LRRLDAGQNLDEAIEPLTRSIPEASRERFQDSPVFKAGEAVSEFGRRI
jgi:hypothetical protein